MKKEPKEPLPERDELKNCATQYLKGWEELKDYPEQEAVLKKLYRKYPENTNFYEVMVKVATLNTFYSTHLKSVPDVVEQILSIRNFDMLLEDGSIWLVDKICSMDSYTPFSFATKYCSHHNPIAYPIYDSFVARVLIEYQNRDNFTTKPITFIPQQKNPKSYETEFYPIIEDFREYYGLTNLSFKKLDRFIWLLGKEYFSNETDSVSYKNATIGDYEIRIENNGSISVSYQNNLLDNRKEGLLKIAKLINDKNLTIDPSMTTRQIGRKIVKHVHKYPKCLVGIQASSKENIKEQDDYEED